MGDLTRSWVANFLEVGVLLLLRKTIFKECIYKYPKLILMQYMHMAVKKQQDEEVVTIIRLTFGRNGHFCYPKRFET
jgi:hypothetical protein